MQNQKVVKVTPVYGSKWEQQYRYNWHQNDMGTLKMTLNDSRSLCFIRDFRDCITDLKCTDEVASKFSMYISQACDRVLKVSRVTGKRSRNGPAWYDKELRCKRSEAIRAGERILCESDRQTLVEKCREYRSCKQKKERAHIRNCIEKVENAYKTDKSNMWKVINTVSNTFHRQNVPESEELFTHFQQLSCNVERDYFNLDFENQAKHFLEKYDQENCILKSGLPNLELEIINKNFTIEEVNQSINYLKNNKSPGIDNIPAEFIKECKNEVAVHLTDALNYIIEKRDFPVAWSEGIRSAIFKSGRREIAEN